MSRLGLALCCFLAALILFLGAALRNPFVPISYPGVLIAAADQKKLDTQANNPVPLGIAAVNMSTPGEVGQMMVRGTVITAGKEQFNELALPVRIAQGELPQSGGEAAVGSLLAAALGLKPGGQVYIVGKPFQVKGVFARTETSLDMTAFTPGPAPLDTTASAYLKPAGETKSSLTASLARSGINPLHDPFQERSIENNIRRFRGGSLLFGLLLAFAGGYFVLGGQPIRRRFLLLPAAAVLLGIAAGAAIGGLIGRWGATIGLQGLFAAGPLPPLTSLTASIIFLCFGWLIASKKKGGSHVPPLVP